MPDPQPPRGHHHYFSRRPEARSQVRTVQLVLPEGLVIHLQTDRGMFSPDHVDRGTRALLTERIRIARRGNLVDLGCGYGPIAIAIAHRVDPDAVIWAVDVNERARELCQLNAETNGVADRIRVVAPEEVPKGLVVDQLWSNPPIRIGKPALHELLRTWLARLRPRTGTAELVVHKHLGSDSLSRWLPHQGYRMVRVATHAGYRILHVAVPS